MFKFRLLLTLICLSSISSTFAEAKSIVVIGGGLAGLTAASDIQDAINGSSALREQNIDLELYEAKDRPGGRVFTIILDGKPAELGGQNINDGGDALTLHRLLKTFNLKTSSHIDQTTKIYFYDQKTDKQYDVEKDLSPAFPDINATDVAQALLEGEKSAKNLSGVVDFFFEKYKSSDSEKTKLLAVIKRMVMSSEKSFEGGDVHDLSPRYAHGSLPMMFTDFLHETYKKKKKNIMSAHVSVKGGNSKLILALAGKLGSKLHLEKPLISMKKSQGDGYDLTFADHDAKESVHADYVVLAIPASVYKNISFASGIIDTDRLNNIKNISYGTHAKILSPHPSADKKKSGFSTQDLYIWTDAGDKWSTFYFGGSAGIMSDAKQFDKGYDLGVKTVGTISAAPKKEQVLIPTKIFAPYKTSVGMSWVTDPFILGSYSYYSATLRPYLESVVTVDDEKLLPLFTPIEDRIYFAGEHTTVDQDIRGTMEAAAASGAKAARLLIKQLHK